MGFILARRHMPPPPGHTPDNGLAAGRDRDVLDDDALLPALALQLRHRLDLLVEQPHQACSAEHVRVYALRGLTRQGRALEKLHGGALGADHLHGEHRFRGGPGLEFRQACGRAGEHAIDGRLVRRREARLLQADDLREQA